LVAPPATATGGIGVLMLRIFTATALRHVRIADRNALHITAKANDL
jgi:hypothetical protein